MKYLNRKINLMLIIIMLIMLITSSCAYRREVPLEDQGQQDIQREDRLAKSDKEAVEENINGFNIEDDLKITQDTEKESRISFLTQQQIAKILDGKESSSMNSVLEQYNTVLPEAITNAVQYFQHEISFNYLLTTAEEGSEILGNPAPDAAVLASIENLDKVTLLQRVEGEVLEDSTIWYRVALENGDQIIDGYIHSSMGTPRAFRFERMLEAVNELRVQLEQGELHFISNYKNQNGTPPQEGDAAIDEYGYRVYHSAPAYEQPDANSNYRYIPDGMLVRILDENEEFYHVNVPTFGNDFFIPKQYIDLNVTLSQLNQVVVIDRSEQNQAFFEFEGNDLNMLSYTLSTTGIPGDFSFETPIGFYKVIEKRDRFEYLQSGTQDIAGYAPFAIRFSGGAYIHGVPVAYEEIDGEKVDPGLIEYLHTIGTFPRSNMCIRNFTSHAKFLHSLMESQNGAVIVIE